MSEPVPGVEQALAVMVHDLSDEDLKAACHEALARLKVMGDLVTVLSNEVNERATKKGSVNG